MVAAHSSRAARQKGHVRKVFPDDSPNFGRRNSEQDSSAPALPSSGLHPAAKSFDLRPNASNVGSLFTDKRSKSRGRDSASGSLVLALRKSPSPTAAQPSAGVRTNPSQSSSAHLRVRKDSSGSPSPSAPAAQTSSDVPPNPLIAELERIQARIGIAHATCRTAQRALEGSGVPNGIDIGRTLGFGASDVLAAEFSRLYALIHCLKERRPLDQWIGRWRP